MNKIGLCGHAGAGKTTASAILVGAGYERISLGAPLKNMLRALGLTEEHLHGALKEIPTDLLEGRSPRQAMQSLGTEWGRSMIGPYIWTNALKRHVAGLGSSPWVCDDIRYQSDAEAIREMGGMIIKIVRPNTNIQVSPHSSEMFISAIEADHTVINDGFVADLHDKIIAIARSA